MKKKKILITSLAATVGLTLAGCNGGGTTGGSLATTTHTYTEAPADQTYDKLGDVNVFLNYAGTSGVTYRGTEAFTNVVDGVTYNEGTLLPTWKAFGDKTGLNIVDVATYSTSTDDDTFNAVSAKGYVGEGNKKIDLFYTTTAHINNDMGANNAVDLEANLDKMPNLKEYLRKNPTVHKTLLKSGKMFYAPYFDGYNDVERMFMMDTSLVEKVLDVTSFDAFDTTINGGKNPAANVVQSGTYTPYIDAENNYAADTTIKVLKNNAVQEITVKKVKNIIVRQNEKLQADAGVTGKDLAKQFQDYLKEAYGDYVGEGKVFAKYSDIFCSESAAYNSDELIALMRVVKANPGVISGDANAEVETLFPRGEADNRVENIADFMQVWGVFGMTSKKDMLYFLQDGTLNDAATTPATYDGLQKLSQIYDEGLILTEFWLKPSSTANGTKYLDKYFKKNASDFGFGLLMYDYCAAQAQGNDMVDGIGTDRKVTGFTGYKGEVKGIRPILPPVAWWNNGTTAKYDAPLSDHTGKTLLRYSEENRALKNTAWCIPATAEHKEAAFRLMDYMFSEKGALIQDFGPEAYWQKPNLAKGDKLAANLTFDSKKAYVATDIVSGELAPVISDATKAMIAEMSKQKKDFWSFMREYIGSTHGVGHVRSKALQVESTNEYGQKGLIALQTAIDKGVVIASRVDKVPGTNTWDTTVPSAGWKSIKDADGATDYKNLTKFWEAKKLSAEPTGWVFVVKEKAGKDLTSVAVGNLSGTDYTYGDVLNEMTAKNKIYLYQQASSVAKAGLAADCIPDYARTEE